MSNAGHSKRPPRTLFFGMPGNFSLPPLQALLESGIEVCAVVIPSSLPLNSNQPAISLREKPSQSRTMLPLLNSTLHATILQTAWERQIPLLEVQRLSDPLTLSTLSLYQPDMICVACFSQRIPPALLALPPFGCLNVHPSLLPANRGPVPLFWTFRQPEHQAGITIHLMDEGMDSGDILAQEPIAVPDGISYAQLEFGCAKRGGALLEQSVWELYQGRATRIPQNEDRSSYHSYPSSKDFRVPVAEWDALHVYNFLSGLIDWGEALILQAGDEQFVVEKVISYSHKDICDELGVASCKQEKVLWVRCRDGWVGVEGVRREKER